MTGSVAARRRLLRRIGLCAPLALLVAIAGGSAAGAQPAYPSRAVQIIVPYGAGGIADAGMRIVADRLSARLKQPFVVENRPGAGGILAAKAASAAPPDGHVVLMTGNNNAIATALFKSLPYDILTDFAPVSTTSFFDLLIVTRAGSPLKSLPDMIKAARASPGKLNIATINPGSTQNLAAEWFRSAAGIDVAIVPFRTSPDMATAVLRGDVDIAFEFYAALQGAILDGQVVALASTGAQRTAYLPAVPTVQESGVKDFEVTSWNGLSLPAAAPAEAAATLTRALAEVLPAPEVQAKAQSLGMQMRASTPAEMGQRMRDDIARWTGVIARAGIPRHD